MDKEKAKELAKILLAYSEGKRIEVSNNNNSWIATSSMELITSSKYVRIKPQPKLVPFTFEDNLLFRDKWIYDKEKELPGVMRIISYNDSNVHVEFGAIGYIHLLNKYCFEDGSPCGKYVNE